MSAKGCLMMDVRVTHFNRLAFVLLPLMAQGRAAPAQLPERVRATPVIVGQLAEKRVPIGGARTAVVLHEVGKTVPRGGCGSPLGRRASDSGVFRHGADHVWLNAERMAALRRSAPEMQHQFVVCVRLPSERRFRVIFKAPALRWDTLHLACDLGRQWLPPDREGRQGYCEAERAAIDGVQLAERLGRQGLPGITCDTTDAVIHRLRIGPVRAMGSLEQLKRLCPSLRDTTVQGEGWTEIAGRQRAMVLTIGGRPVIIHPQAGVVAQISIRTPGLRTADGIEVGSPASAMHRWQDLHSVVGATDLLPYGLAWTGGECGATFYFNQPFQPKGNAWDFATAGEMRAWPDSFRIRRIVIGACPHWYYLDKYGTPRTPRRP